MANTKETVEFVKLPVGVLNAIIKSLEDGKFQPIQDIPNFIAPLLSAQPAIEGIKAIPTENALMTIPERETVKAAIRAELSAANEDDKYDLTEGLNGILSFIRLAWRRGIEAGENRLKEDLLARGFDVDSVLRGEK